MHLAGAADAPVDRAALVAAMKGMNEWSRFAIFDDAGTVISSTFTVDPSETEKWLHAWDERDVTVGEGSNIDSQHFEVHRYDASNVVELA